jgi:hypothetical protein
MSQGCRHGSRVAAVVMMLLCGAPSAGPKPKVTAQEVVARYLDSLGPAAAREAVKSRVARGTCQLSVVMGGTGGVFGRAVFESDGRRVGLQADFNYQDYPREAVAFDGEKVVTPNVVPGHRSRLGDIAYTYGIIVREGLLGAAVSTASPLLDLSGRRALLDYEGLKKINGRELHQLLYRPRRGEPNMTIRLYFEPETFRHVMTIYDVAAAGTLGTNPDLPEQSTPNRTPAPATSRMRLEETYDTFKPAPEGLTLPRAWKIRLTLEPATGPARAYEWTIALTSISHSEAMDPALFAPR